MKSLKKISNSVLELYTRSISILRQKPRLSTALLGVLLLVIFLYGLRVIKDDNGAGCIVCPVSRSDFHDYYKAAARLRAGKDPYNMELLRKFRTFRFQPGDLQDPQKFLLLMEFRSIGSYLYPPFTAYILQPLALLPYKIAAAFFQILSFVCFVGFLLILRRNIKSGSVSFSFLALCALLVVLRFCMENFSNGNIAFFLILLCGAGLILSWSRFLIVEFLGGVLLGVASIIKVTPAFFGLVIFGGRRWAAIGGMAAGGAIALALPAATMGWEYNLKLLDDWRSFLLGSFQEIGFIRPWANNQTVSAAIGKLFIPFSDPAQGRFGLPFLYAHGIPDGSKQFLANLVRAINLILYGTGAVVAMAVAYFRPRHGGGFLADIQAVRVTMLALLISLVGSGVSWYHAYSILLIPLFARLYQHFVLKRKLEALEKIAIGVIAFFGLVRLVLPSEVRAAFSLYSVFAWLCVALIAIHVYLLLGRRFRPDEPVS